MGAIHLIRHGQASFGKANYDQLSELGKRQAEQAGKHFAGAGITFHRLASGKMVRHQETLAHCLLGMQQITHHPQGNNDATVSFPEPLISDAFNEFDHEEIVARFRPEFEDKAALASYLAAQAKPAAAFQIIFDQSMRRWLSGLYDSEYNESWAAFCDRCVTGFNALLQRGNSSENIAIFTSGGPISVITQHLLGVPNEHVLKLSYAIINASITKVLYNGDSVSLSSFNSYSHLENASTPSLVTYR